MYSVQKQEDTGMHSKDSIIQAIETGTHYDINELKPIYAAYNSAELDEDGTSWTLKQAIGERLVEHAHSEDIIQADECKQAGGKLLEHADSKDELIKDEECLGPPPSTPLWAVKSRGNACRRSWSDMPGFFMKRDSRAVARERLCTLTQNPSARAAPSTRTCTDKHITHTHTHLGEGFEGPWP